MSSLALLGLSKRHRVRGGADTVALDRLTFSIDPGELFVLVGSSGSGKTTTLRLIAGLDAPDSGRIELDGRDLAGVAPKDRGVALVFQDHPLFPHLNVAENLAFTLRLRGHPARETADRVWETAAVLGIGQLLDRLPATLSGGERQRVALGAALVTRPRLLLLDEPLAQLDAPLRTRLRMEIRRLQHELGLTLLHVTHDQSEAMALADRMAVLRGGVLQQAGPPLELYRRPANAFVARFLGAPGMNLLPVRWREGARSSGSLVVQDQVEARWTGELPPGVATGPAVMVAGFRPEAVEIGIGEANAGLTWRGDVGEVENLGHESLVRLRIGAAGVVLRMPPGRTPSRAEVVSCRVSPENVHWFEAAAADDGPRLG